MKINKNKIGTELQCDVPFTRLVLTVCEAYASHQPSQNVRHTFEPRMMRYLEHHVLPMVAGHWKCGYVEKACAHQMAFPLS